MPDAKPEATPKTRARGESLLRVLGRAGVVPGGAVEKFIRSGRVNVEGASVRDPVFLPPAGATVTIDGAPVSLAWRTRALAFHKYEGIVSDPVDPEGKGTVFEALRKHLEPSLADFAWHACGRLDRNTSGLLLFTNDPGLVEHLTSPDTKLPKTYVATVSGVINDERLEALRTGVDVDGHRTAPALVTRTGDATLELVITEGRHHQVKKMVAAVNLTVTALHRRAIGTLEVRGKPGRARELSDDDLRRDLRYEPVAGPERRDTNAT